MADIIFPGEAPVDNVGKNKLPSNMDLSIWQGDAQEFIISLTSETGTPINLAGCTASALIRQSIGAPTSYAFTCTIEGTNNVRVKMTSAVCKTIMPGSYVWNFQITAADGSVRTYLAGDVTVYAEVD